MNPDDYVAALYRHVLKREPDGGGLTYHADLIRAGANPTEILQRLLSSDEYQERTGHHPVDTLWRSAIEFLGEGGLTIVDVGAQVLDFEDHIYAPLLRDEFHHHVIGFEPLADRVEAREQQEKGRSLTLYPFAIGDGESHVLHVNNDDATSSLFPIDRGIMDQFEHLHTLHEVSELKVDTKRLDDVLPDQPVSFLKLDIQGAELLALKGAERILKQTAVIHCEVEFAPIYAGQPLFSEVHNFLAKRDFILIDLMIPHRYAYRNRKGIDGRDRLLWGEAVFMRDSEDVSTLAAQATIAALVYRKPSLAQHLLERCGAAN